MLKIGTASVMISTPAHAKRPWPRNACSKNRARQIIVTSPQGQIELRGYRCDIGLDGLPTDSNPPFNRAR